MSEHLVSHKADVTIPVYGTIADADVYLKDKVDAILDKKNKALEYARELTIKDIKIIDEQKAEITELKAKLENVQNSMYCDVVDANMKISKLSRSLWLARALFNGRSCEYFSGMASRCKIGQEEFYQQVDKRAKRYLKACYKCRAMAEKFK